MLKAVSICLPGVIAAAFLAGTPVSAAVSFSNLGVLPGFTDTHAPGISSDGSTVAGFCQTSGGSYRAFRWSSSGGMQDIGIVPGLPRSLGFATNATGSVVVGTAETSSGNALSAFRWTQSGGMQNIGSDLVAYGVSGDGTVITGKTTTGFSRAFLWTSGGGVQELGTLSGDSDSYGLGIINADGLPTSEALAISGDGNAVVGMSESRAFLWRSSLGMVDLNVYLPTLGIDLSGWTLERATGTSADGMTICGEGYYLGQYRSWVAAVPAPSVAPIFGISGLMAARRRRI